MTRTLLALVCLASLVLPAAAADTKFNVRFSPRVQEKPYTGRVYLFFSRQGEPRNGPNWFRPEPIIAREVKDWKPGEALTIDRDTAGLIAFPKPLAELDLKGHSVQAVARFNFWEREVGRGPGNGFSPAAKLEGGEIALEIDKVVPQSRFEETKWAKRLEVPSPLLSGHNCRPTSTVGAVLLPASYYDQPERRYPVLLTIPGFGGTHFEASGMQSPIQEKNPEGVEFLRVILDPSCRLGHHVFADSANNGPVGTALVKEFLPELDRQYRTVAKPSARFLTGHSSGGWSSLWLQVAWPDSFGGTWSTSPDPVDFHDFQRIDLYAGDNMYRDRAGERRPLARFGQKVALWYDDFDRMESAVGFGGQLHSFEAVFSPRGPGLAPLLAWDRETGKVNPDVVKAWEAYDIRLILERRWKELGPRLAGKLHVLMGDTDTFYLEGATVRLKETLKSLGSDAVVEILPGKDHFNLLSTDIRERIRREMSEAFLRSEKAE